MTGALLLALLLASPAPEVLEGATVTKVRLDLPDADQPRFAPLVELRPGDVLDRGKIRHIVQVFYATGAFEDVQVSAEREGEGFQIVIHPIWAPFLRDIVVHGDPVLSPKDIQRIAKLRTTEPLFDARLEKAGRDIALALSDRGYLEAHVAPVAFREERSADAIFTVHAGAKVRVGEVRIEGAAERSAELERLAKPGRSQIFRTREAVKAAEAMRRRLASSGYWKATVKPRESYDPSRGLMTLVFEVSSGPHWTLEARGGRFPTNVRSEAESRLRDSGLKVDVVEEVSERLEEDLLRRGYRDVSVSHAEESRSSGMALVFEIRPGAQARVASLKVTGWEGVKPQPPLATRAGEPLSDFLVDQDARTLTSALRQDGYAGAKVTAEVPDGGGEIPVVFRVQPGPRTIVHSISIDASPPPPGVSFESLRVKAGLPYRARDVALDAKDLQAAYQNGGFLNAQVVPDVVFSEGKMEATITIRASPGAETYVDHIILAGLEHTQEKVVRRELLVKERAPLGLQKVLESQRHLSSLGIFDRVSITEMDPESGDARSLVVRTEEAPPTSVTYGLGYAERDLVRGSVDVTRRNISGLDRSLSFYVRGSVAGNRVFVTYREPYPFSRKGEVFATAYHEEEKLDTFSYSRTGYALQTARNLSAHLSLFVRYTFQQTSVFSIQVPLDQVDRQFRNSVFSGPSASLVNDNRNDPLDPSRGHFLGADVQISSKGLGGDSFVKGFLQASTYHEVLPGLLLALSARFGLARTFNDEPPELPLPDRFFAGGDYSIRGFAIDTVGPLAPSSTGVLLPTGGNALLTGSAELRINAGGHFQVALFTDAGNVYPLIGDMTLSDLRYTAGFGLRYKSALGPLRVDYGYKLNRRPGDSPGHVHITIGYAF